jgi:hypothetical protein
VLSQVYFDYEVAFDRKDFITLLYVLFANDHATDDFAFATDLLQDYIENNFHEFNQNMKEGSGSKKRNRKWKGNSKRNQ